MKKFFKFIMWVIILFFGLSILSVIIYRFVPVPASPLMFIRLAQQFKDGEQLKLAHQWVPLDEISPELPRTRRMGK